MHQLKPTRVIHIKDAPPGWKTNPDYVFIGRGSKWGNEYSHLAVSRARHQVSSREEAVDGFERNQLPGLRQFLPELRGRILVCFCHPKACHGHVLAREADKER